MHSRKGIRPTADERGIEEFVDILGYYIEHSMLKIEMHKVVCDLKIAISMVEAAGSHHSHQVFLPPCFPNTGYKISVGRTQEARTVGVRKGINGAKSRLWGISYLGSSCLS